MLDFIRKCLLLSRRQLSLPIAGLMLTIGMSAIAAEPLHNQDAEISSAATELLMHLRGTQKDAVAAAKGNFPQKDGIYLYGKSPEPNKIGQEYIVFEVKRGQVVGALYMPQSEFSCFNGTIKAGELAMMVAGFPDNGETPQEVAAVGDPSIGTGDEPILYPYSVQLQNYHQLSKVSENDQRILGMCKNSP